MFRPGDDFPDSARLAVLGARLDQVAERTRAEGPWRSGAMAALAGSGALAGFVPADCGGAAASERAITRLLVAVSERCLTTALALSQWASAVRIIAGATECVRTARLPPLAAGSVFTTVGISQVTTSRQHLASPALGAAAVGDDWRLDGVCPWVTGADSSDTIVTAAAGPDGERRFFVVPTDAAGVVIDPPLPLLALSGSRTSAVHFRAVRPADAIRPAGPPAPRSGGLATTALALGAARAACAVVRGEAAARPALRPIASGLEDEAAALEVALLAAAGGDDAAPRDPLRATANGLVVRAAQAALTASKGAGFVQGHPAERLARESMFFLVWSCPPAVVEAALCDFVRPI